MNINAQEREDLPVNPANRRKYLNIEFVRAQSRRSRAAGFCFYILLSTFVFRDSKFGFLRPSDFVMIDLLWAAGVNWTMRFRRFGITLGLLLMAAFVHGQDSFANRTLGDDVHAAKGVHQRRIHLFYSGNPGHFDLWAIHLRLGLPHPRAAGFLRMAVKKDGASSETVSIAAVDLRSAHWRPVHVCLACGIPVVLRTARTAYSEVHQSSGDH